MNEDNLIVLNGSCHCKKVCFSVKTKKKLIVWKCDCSICDMKKNYHFIVPKLMFNLNHDLETSELLQEYTYNTRTAKHFFCKTCGVQSFYQPRSNPDGFGITLSCIDKEEIKLNNCSIEMRRFEGSNWEEFYESSDIKELSKFENI